MTNSIKLSFRNKLLLLFLTLSIIPLVILAFVVSQTVENRYKETLSQSFKTNVEYTEKIVSYYLEGNKNWIKSITAQNIFLEELEKHVAEEAITESKVVTALNSLKNENQFIEKIYIIDTKGQIIASTKQEDEGKNTDSLGISPVITKQPQFLNLRSNEAGARIITLIAPFIQKDNEEIIGYLVTEFQSTVIKSLINGSLYKPTSDATQLDPTLGQTYIIDEDAYILTNKDIQKSPATYPLQTCELNTPTQTAIWVTQNTSEVFGSFKCSTIDQMKFTYIVEQPAEAAFAISNAVMNTIFFITFAIGFCIILAIYKISGSVTNPIKKLAAGAREIGQGNFSYNFDIKTGDEIENLSKSFSEMAHKISDYVTNLKAQEEKLNSINAELESEKETISAERNKFEVIIAGITDAIIALNLDRKVISCNKAAQDLLSLTEEQIIGSEISKLFKLQKENDDLAVTEFAPIRKDEYEGIIYSSDKLKLMSSGGKTTMVRLITGKIKEAVGVNLGCILTLHDISKESQLEDMKLDFVSMAAHELRTPITSIRGYSELLGDEVAELNIPQASDWKTLISRISISAEQLLALVENLLNVTKIEKGILSISCKPENWKQNIDEVAAVFKERAANKQIKLTVESIDDSLVAYVDRIRINEVISNLISNAINYTPSGGSVTVESHVTPDGDWIETSVTDNGKGIPKSAQNHLFEKFFRVTGPLEQGSKGNGLGLYISKSIVEMHSGKIWVESDEGKGAKFTYTVPRMKDPMFNNAI